MRVDEKYSKPNKKIYTLPNAGHFLMMDQIELFYDALVEIKSAEEKGEFYA